MYLCGKNGTGKTALACLLAMEARKHGYTALFLNASEIVSATITREKFDDSQTLMQRAASVDLLVIDDMGKETISESKDSDAVMRIIETIVRTRVGNLRSTIMTSNLHSIEEVDARYKSSFFGLMAESFIMVKMTFDQRTVESQKLVQAVEQ